MKNLITDKNNNLLDGLNQGDNNECANDGLAPRIEPSNNIGRPKQSWHEKLKSKTAISLKNLKDTEALFISKNSIENKSPEEAEQIRILNSQQIENGNYLLNIEKNLDSNNSKELSNTKKRLLAVLSEREHKIQCDEDTIRPIGRPSSPISFLLARARHEFRSEHENLNNYEFDNNLSLTSKDDLMKMVSKRRNMKVGRRKNNELQNLDKSIRRIKKTINRIKNNINQQDNHKILGKKQGRKKHGIKELSIKKQLLDVLMARVAEIESKMTDEQLLKRQIRQLKSKRHGLKQKQYHVKNEQEHRELKKQLKDLDLAIEKKQKLLDQQYKQDLKVNKSIRNNNLNLSNNKSPKVSINKDCDLLMNKYKKAIAENIKLKSALLKISSSIDLALLAA